MDILSIIRIYCCFMKNAWNFRTIRATSLFLSATHSNRDKWELLFRVFDIEDDASLVSFGILEFFEHILNEQNFSILFVLFFRISILFTDHLKRKNTNNKEHNIFHIHCISFVIDNVWKWNETDQFTYIAMKMKIKKWEKK